MRSLIKKLVYGLIDMLTSGKGVPKTFEGNKVRMPTKYFRYFPVGYEKDNFNFINKKVRPGMTILDIGAHIGLMSTVFGKKVGPSGKVFAFEPTPTTVSTLKHTIAINDLANVSVEPFALSDQIGKLTFYISDNAVDNSNSLVNNHRVDRAEKGIEVDVYTVDNFVKDRNISKVDFMKIDVEGAELRVLKGAQKNTYQPQTHHNPCLTS